MPTLDPSDILSATYIITNAPPPPPPSEWTSILDDTKWVSDGKKGAVCEWDGSSWVSVTADDAVVLLAIGTWATGYRPTKVRVTYTSDGGSPLIFVLTDNAELPNAIVLEFSYVSGTEVDITVIEDIAYLYVGSDVGTSVSNIEFYEEA